MPSRKTRPSTSNSQYERFVDKARELGTDQDEATFDAKLGQILTAPRHASDCRVHDAPAYEPGQCTCGAVKDER